MLVSTSADMRDAVRVPVGADGTIRYSVPGTFQGRTTVYVQRESGGEPAATSFVVDTVKPRILRAILTRNVVRSASSLTKVPGKPGRSRYFIRNRRPRRGDGNPVPPALPTHRSGMALRGILTKFSARVAGKTVRVRIADAAGNTSDWRVIPLRKATTR